uniref:Uncharacterized protein n=1 Tax=Noccaea caerulescens TaxID=107243 RepID=A0A1J3K988_NOCCA
MSGEGFYRLGECFRLLVTVEVLEEAWRPDEISVGILRRWRQDNMARLNKRAREELFLRYYPSVCFLSDRQLKCYPIIDFLSAIRS